MMPHNMMNLEQSKPQPPPLQEKKSVLEEAMMDPARSQAEIAKSQSQFVNDTKTTLNNQSTQIMNIEVKLGQSPEFFMEEQS